VEVRTERDIPVGPTTRWYARPDATTSDAAGRFTLWLLPGISHRLVAGAEGYGDTRKTGVTVESGGVEIGDLALQKADRVIAGRVTDVMGDPVAGARISVWSQAQPRQRSAVTDAQGRYRIERLAAGRVQVELEHPAYSFEFRNSVQTGSTRVDFTLTPDESRRPKERLKPGDPAPEIAAAQWLNGGGARSLKSLRGQVVVLQFATPYNPAVEAASDRLNALRRKYGARGVSILALYDASLPPGETAAYVRARRLPYPVGLVPQTPLLGWNSAPFKRYGVYAVPSLFVIDRSGKVRAVNPSPAELERQVQTLARGR
jgi:peroxiredoxin